MEGLLTAVGELARRKSDAERDTKEPYISLEGLADHGAPISEGANIGEMLDSGSVL